MTEQLESQLRQVLAQRAEQMPDSAYAQLRRGDYKPRSPIQRPALALGGAAGVAALAAIVLSIVGLGAGTQRAFAGWTPEPSAPAGGRIASAESACKDQMATPAERARAREQASGRHRAPELPPVAEGGPWQTVLTDTRGPYTIVLLADANGSARCLTGPAFSPYPAIGVGEGSDSGTDFTEPVGQIGVTSYGFSRADDEQPYMDVSGRVGTGVSGVTLVLDDGTHVVASIAHGWLLAWWPGTQRAVSAQVTDNGQTKVVQLDDPISLGSSGS